MANLLSYGIAVNFFGNYMREAREIGGITDRLTNSLQNLQNMVIAGGFTAALYRFSNAMLTTAKTMEQNFSTLASSLGSTTRAIEALEWARQKGASTPFGIDEVNKAVALMTSLGLNRDNEMREKVFKAVGDFAGVKGAGFDDMMQRVSKAGFGNWESLGDQYGVRRQNIGGMVREQMARTPEKFEGEQKSIAEAIKLVETGVAGTEKYKMAVIELIGVLGRDGMLNRLNTIAGAWSNVGDITENFMLNMVGYSQVTGTFANTVKETIVKNILEPFSESHEVMINGIKETTTSVDQLGRVGKGVGQLLTGVWDGINDAIGNSSRTIVDWIDKLDAFFRDYKNNVAPLILFLFLVRLEVEMFLEGFVQGFGQAFGFFIKSIGAVYTGLAKLIDWLGLTEDASRSLGLVVGWTLGIMLGMRAFRFAMQPFAPLQRGANLLWQELVKVYTAQKAVLLADGELAGLTGIQQFLKTIQYLTLPLQGVASASWSFTASLLANPITWIVIAVIALVVWIIYLVQNWNEVQASMQGVTDIALYMLSVFMPIVGLPLLMAKYWEQLKNIVSNVWRGITGFALSFWLILKNEVLIPLKNAFVSTWSAIKKGATQFFDYILQKFPFLMVFVNAFKDAWAGVASMFSSVWDFFSRIYNAVVNSDFIGSIVNFAETVSDLFGDSGEDSAIEQAKKYDPKLYEQLVADKNARLYEEANRGKQTSGSTQNNTQKEADTKYDMTGSTVNIVGLQNPKGMFDAIDEHTKSKGK